MTNFLPPLFPWMIGSRGTQTKFVCHIVESLCAKLGAFSQSVTIFSLNHLTISHHLFFSVQRRPTDPDFRVFSYAFYSDMPVEQHFHGLGHLLEDVRVALLKSGLSKKDVRQREEMRQIFKFRNTLSSRDKSRFLISIKSRDTRPRIFFARANSFKTAHDCQ